MCQLNKESPKFLSCKDQNQIINKKIEINSNRIMFEMPSYWESSFKLCSQIKQKCFLYLQTSELPRSPLFWDLNNLFLIIYLIFYHQRMPKNKGRGGKSYRRGNNKTQVKRELVRREQGTMYGQVIKMLGNGRLQVFCFDNVKRLGNIRGKMKRRVWISAGDVVLVSLREFQNDKCDVILKYTSEEVRMLKAEDEIPENIEANENNDDNIEFAEKQGGDDDSDSDEDSEESDSDEEIEVPKKLAEKDIDDI